MNVTITVPREAIAVLNGIMGGKVPGEMREEIFRKFSEQTFELPDFEEQLEEFLDAFGYTGGPWRR